MASRSSRTHTGGRVTPCAGEAQVTAGKDLYVSETTDLVDTGAQDASGADGASAASGTAGRTRRRGSGLSGMLLPELQRLAAELGIPGTARMRKGDLVAAISARQVGEDTPASVPAARGAAVESRPLEAPISGGANGGPLTAPADGTADAPAAADTRAHTKAAGNAPEG